MNANATHISEPVLSDPKTKYRLGEKIVLNGWVSYNDQPAPDVLLNFKVTGPNDTTVDERSFPSNSSGHFTYALDSNDLKTGSFQVTITSHCLDIHRHICTYKQLNLPIQIIDKNTP